MKIDKSWYIKPNNPNFPFAISAGGVVVRKEKGKLLIALLGLNKYKSFSLPKGTNEMGESIEETAVREICEETGLSNLTLICKLGVKERFTIEKSIWKITHYYLFQTEEISGRQNLQPDEGNLKLKWFDFEKLPSIFWPEQKELIEENREHIKKIILV